MTTEERLAGLEELLHEARESKAAMERRYLMVIIALVGIACGALGFGVQSERSLRQVAVNTATIATTNVRLDAIDRRLTGIETSQNNWMQQLAAAGIVPAHAAASATKAR